MIRRLRTALLSSGYYRRVPKADSPKKPSEKDEKPSPLMTIVDQETGPDGEVVVGSRFGPDYIYETSDDNIYQIPVGYTNSGIPIVEEIR